MNFDFVIPITRDDLLSRTEHNQYVVDEVFSVRQLHTKVQECKAAFRTKGPTSVLTTFDTYYSVLKNFCNVEPELKEDLWELLLKAASSEANKLVELLEEEIEPDTRWQHLNILKMTCYLLCQFTESFESDACKPSTTTVTAKGRKKTVKPSVDMGCLEWDVERDRSIRAMLQLLQLHVHRLWDPPIVEEEFVNLVTNCCYKLLENPNINKATSKVTRDTIFHLLGVMVKKYNHSLGFSLKLMQLLQHFEHLAVPMAEAVELIVTEFGVKSVAGDIMREIGRIDPRDMARDTSGTRAFAGFMVELSDRIPVVILPNISILIALLDGESYTMRNSVLGVLGELIIQVLSKEDLNEKQKATRDQFLEKLEDHIHDVHAFVRSKVLQIWLRIVNEKALPLPQQHSLLELVIGRLHDKSSQVRKYSIHLLTALLRTNPFAAKLPLEELKASYEQEKDKLKEMLPDEPPASSHETVRREAEEEWKKLLKDVKKTCDEIQEEDDDETGDVELPEEETAESLKEKLVELIKSRSWREAITLYQAGRQAWPQDVVFSVENDDQTTEQSAEESSDSESEADSSRLGLLAGLKLLFLGDVLGNSLMAAAKQGTNGEVASQDNSIVNEIAKQQVLVQYLKDSMNFASSMQKAVPVICLLLGSKSNTDVLESIDFFVTGFKFGLTNAMVGIRRMMVLVWSKENSIKEALVEAYKDLYLHPDAPTSRAQAVAVANNLMALTSGATLGELTSLEELVCEFVRSKELDQGIIQVLWEKFAKKIANTTDDESRSSLLLLGMAAGAEIDIVKSNVEVLVKEGLGQRADEDFLLARETCSTLLKLGGTTKCKAGSYEEPFRLAQDHNVFERLSHLLVQGITKLEKPYWIPLAEQAVNVIYKLAEHPDLICGDVIKKIANVVVSYKHQKQDAEQTEPEPVEEKGNPENTEDNNLNSKDNSQSQEGSSQTDTAEGASSQPDTTEGGSSQPDTDVANSQSGPSCPAAIITRLLALAGHVAFKQLVHLDVAVFGELKRRNNLKEEEVKKRAEKNNAVSASVRKKKEKNDELTMEEEMGLTGAVADDVEAEYIRKITEEELVTGSNVLGVLRPLVVAVCTNQVKYHDPDMRAAATLALAKYMMVSSEFCDAHIQLLVTILEKSPNPVIRANTIIAMGDLTFRFPNLIEPWTSNLYARLRDDSPRVRKNTLMVLTHLILNDMVKVKGQISELATCIVDDDVRISNLARLFFSELSKKGQAIYNIMPDIISRLSDPEVGIAEDPFRVIMRYLFTFIQKDKQCESLVEKLCHRFRSTRLERQWRDLSFCLSLMSYTEKSLNKLQENFSCYSDKLFCEDVYASFQTIITGAKKFAKPEAKVAVEELEHKLEQCHSKGVEDDEASEKASKASAAAKASRHKTPAKGLGRRRKGKTPGRTRHKPSEADSADSEEEFLPPTTRRSGRTKPKLELSSDENSDSDLGLFEVDNTKQDGEAENVQPNISVLSPGPTSIRKRHKSVNNKQAKVTPVSRTRTRRKVNR